MKKVNSHSYAVMVDDGFHDIYPTKERAKQAAASLRGKGLKARIQKVPADLVEYLR